MEIEPLVLVNAVGLTGKLLSLAPRLRQLAGLGWTRPLTEPFPAVTTTCQATLLTGKTPSHHGIVGNGWFFRDTAEVRFWQQSNSLIQAEPLYTTARKRAARQGKSFTAAKWFWWYNQGADVDFSLTPKPWYGADGNKAFGITGDPDSLPGEMEKEFGPFPFHTFWGPLAGIGCTGWIARTAAGLLLRKKPTLTLVYLPHLDYEPQRKGPAGCDMKKEVEQLDAACQPILDAAKKIGARVWVVSEYGHVDVQAAIEPNRLLRKQGLLTVRDGPFGETIDFFNSPAFAVCDHQAAHVYVRKPEALQRVRELFTQTPGVARVYDKTQLADLGLAHERSGDLVLASAPNHWFAYPYWLERSGAPDFAPTVDIHRKPGYDPCELFFDPRLAFPKLRVARKLLGKKLGFRTLMDVIPLDPALVKGSHGLVSSGDDDGALLIGDGPAPGAVKLPMTAVRDLVLTALGLEE
ncbi:MAG: alkaline phosphatase family protein [Gemmataceae bacterium]|nr:alkaline phosphatase family protein [Gemmataceae bacterium]